MIPESWIRQAHIRLADHITVTPVTHDPDLDVYLKWENQQVTGSFKLRGALNKAMVLEDWERQAGLLTASAGNHGLGVALAGRILEVPVVVYASQNAVPTKLEAMRAQGAELRLVPGGYG
ncbi:MAG: pyridoxal-phosphate dependent enzyme, partial [Anaerolineales bacterium]|nr:pyridoxal-phosphate dependent enzyme [Anaerolineales bacterium]